MHFEHRGEIGQVEQFADARIRPRELQSAAARFRHHPDEHEFAQTGGVDPLYAFKIQYDFSGMLQSFRHHARERSGLVAIHDAAFAVHEDDVSEVASFQTEFQLRLLAPKGGDNLRDDLFEWLSVACVCTDRWTLCRRRRHVKIS